MGGTGAAGWLALFLMWAVMMIVMMLPSAAPVIRLVLKGYRAQGGPHARASAGVFVSGYLLAWAGFSVLAASSQTLLRRAALLSASMTIHSAAAAGTILVMAGVYQWLPVKQRCLSHCRSPLDVLMRHFRDGLGGALGMGLHHGLYCVGCCWALMALLFVGGVMNFLWIAALAAFVVVEKLARTAWIGRVAGILLILWGTYEVLA